MKVYCTTTNDPVRMLYLGTSVEAAENAVGDFSKYQKDAMEFPAEDFRKKSYSILPENIEWEIIQFYAVDVWWASIVIFELEET